MTAIAQKAGLKLFEKHLQQYAPVDPLYETYTDAKGRQKRRKVRPSTFNRRVGRSHACINKMTVILSCIQREVPPGLSKRDARILKSVKKRAHYLDTGLNICGFRVGWTFFVGALGPYLLSAIPLQPSSLTFSQGAVPGAGDALNAVLGYYLVIRKARQAELSDIQSLPLLFLT